MAVTRVGRLHNHDATNITDPVHGEVFRCDDCGKELTYISEGQQQGDFALLDKLPHAVEYDEPLPDGSKFTGRWPPPPERITNGESLDNPGTAIE